MIVRESISFKRGRDPRSSMGIGEVNTIVDKWNALQQRPGIGSLNLNIENGELLLKIYVSYMPNSFSMGSELVKKIMGLEYFDNKDAWIKGPEIYYKIKDQYADLFQEAFRKIYGVEESVNFERGKDPKSSMEIGMEKDLKDYRLDNYFEKWGPYRETINSILRAFPGKILGDLYVVGTSYASSIIQNRIEELESSGEIVDEWTSEGTLGDENFTIYDTEQGILLKRHDPSMPADSWFGGINMAFYLFNGLEMVGESVNFKRGKDPKDNMGIGLKEKIYQSLLDLNNVPGVLEMKVRAGSPRGPRFVVNYVGDKYKPILGEEGRFWEYTVNNLIGDYVKFDMGNPDDQYFSFAIYPEYVDIFKEIFDEDDAKGTNESVNFERGQDPKRAMRISYGEELKDKFFNYFNNRYLDERKFEIIDGILYTWGLNRKETEEYHIKEAGLSEFLNMSQMRIGRKVGNRKRWEIPVKKQYREYLEGLTNKVTESVHQFERGQDPRKAMGIGAGKFIELMEETGYDAAELRFVKMRLSGIYSDLGDKDFFKKELYDVLLYPEDWNIDKNSGYYDDVKWAYDNIDWAYDLVRIPDDEIYPDELYESLEFERGKDPRSTMGIGADKLIRKFSLGEQISRGFSPSELMPISSLMKLSLSEIYELGFAGEIDYGEWHFNEYTKRLYDLTIEGELIKSHHGIKAAPEVLVYKTSIGLIAKAFFDEEGMYFYGDKEAAIKLEIWKQERESIY